MIELISERLKYRALTQNDVTDKYVDWLNDPKVNHCLEVKHNHNTNKNCSEFVEKMNDDPTQHLFGIFIQDDNRHIGNIKLGFINDVHQRAQLSLFIGDISCWGKGFATEAIKTITQWGFKTQALEKIEAGCYDVNLGSLRAFLKAGYQVEGYLRKNILLDGQRIGSFWLGILPNEIA